MFLETLVGRNPEFVRSVVQLHQEGRIPPNSFVLDLDAIRENARVISEEAARLGLRVLAMTKQVGRNPAFMGAVCEGGIEDFTAVDMTCARAISVAGFNLTSIGHLVQVPRAEALEAAGMRPAYWTVFSMEKAKEAAAAAVSEGCEQRIMARVIGGGDVFKPGQEGGVAVESLPRFIEEVETLPGTTFAGITTYPALLFDSETHRIVPAPNLLTLQSTADLLNCEGLEGVEVNAPGQTSTAVLETLASAGATQVEPGHGFTGTTYLHAYEDLPERPAILYLSEISHSHADKAYCFGGGLYVGSQKELNALVGKSPEEALSHRTEVRIPPAGTIDFYGELRPNGETNVRSGDTVVFGFRPQVFFTRANVVPVSGISKGLAEPQGVFTADGMRIR